MKEIVKFFSLMLLGVCLFIDSTQAFENVIIHKADSLALDQTYQISGASQFNGYYYAVTKNDPNIYLLQKDESKKNSVVSKLSSLHDLTTFPGYSSITKNRGLNFEGVATCSNVFYLVNENMSNLIKAEVNEKKLAQMNINEGVFEDYKDQKQKGFIPGFIGISADCDHKILYVAKRQTPNKIFVVDISNPKSYNVINAFDLGSEKKDNISDLAYLNGLIYVLQKNVNSIFAIRSKSNGYFTEVARYDYSITSNFTRKSDDEGNAEGLIIQKKSDGSKIVYLFLDSKNALIKFKI